MSGHAQVEGAFHRFAARIEWLFLAAILLALAAQFLLALRIVVNWDEFHFLSFVHEHVRGEPIGRFQTLHVHLFSWLPGFGATEIDEIVAGRFVMAAFGCASVVLLYAIARRFLSREGALFGAVAYLSVASVIEHMASFRTDPLATFLCLLALFLLLRRPGATVVGAALAGIVMAPAMMVTVKCVFYLAAIGLALLCLAPRWPVRIRLALSFAIPFLLAFAVLFWWHGTTLAPRMPDNETAEVGAEVAAEMAVGATGGMAGAAGAAGAIDTIVAFLQNTGSKMFVEDGLVPRWRYLLISLALNPLFWIVTLCGAGLALRDARNRDRLPSGEAVAGEAVADRRNGWLALAIAFPVATPLFYRNAFDYNFVFILPPAAILAGLGFEWLRARATSSGRRAAQLLFVVIALGPLAFLAAGIARNLPDETQPQRRTIDAVHRIFPAPVPYIDGYGAVARFPRVGFFTSSWGLDRYRAAGRPVYADLMAATQPPLLLADSPALHAALLDEIEVPDELALLPADAAFLATHYRQYWGMIFVAGQSLAVAEPGGIGGFEIVVAGDYRLDATGQVRIDGFPLEPGTTVRLEAGRHEFRAGPGMTEAALIWAAAQPAPETAPVGLLEFFGAGP
ncbi:MAG: glycosyltransferase family 39 protein [Dongiaceae bacterium]